MRKISKVLSTIFLACTAVGLFSVNYLTKKLNSDNQQNVEMKEADAWVDDRLYFTVISPWNGGNTSQSTMGDHYIWMDTGGLGYNAKISNWITTEHYKSGGSGTIFYDDYWGWVAGVDKPTEKVKFNNGSTGATQPAHTDNVYPFTSTTGNFFVLNTNYDGAYQQDGFFTNYFTTSNTWSGDSAPLYFVPNYTWLVTGVSAYYDVGTSGKKTLDPYIYYEWNDANGKHHNANWPGVHYSSVTNGVYKFDNVPLTTLTQLTISYRKDFSLYDNTPPKFNFSSTSLSNWWNGSAQTKNVFGAPGSGEYKSRDLETKTTMTTYTGDYAVYDWDAAPTFISGSIYNENMNVADASAAISNATTLTGTPKSYTASMINSDKFSLFWNMIDNTSIASYGSTVGSKGVRKGYSDFSSITIYDNSISSSTPIASDKKNLYISDSSDHFCIVKSGDVTVSISTNRSLDITLRWSSNSSESFTPSSATPDNVYGSINNNSHTANVLEWTPLSGRFESLCAIKQGESFKFAYGSTDSTSVSSISAINGATVTTSVTDNVMTITVTSGTDFYSIGWYYSNDSTFGVGAVSETVVFFIDKTGDFVIPRKTTTDAIDTLTNKLSYCKTCDLSVGDSTVVAFETLFSIATTNGTDTTLINYMKSNSCNFNDYDYTQYVINGYSYEGLNKITTTNAYAKYMWIQYLYNEGPYPTNYAVQDLQNSVVYQESNMVIVIVIASISAFAIVSLGIVNYLVIKKRKQK